MPGVWAATRIATAQSAKSATSRSRTLLSMHWAQPGMKLVSLAWSVATRTRFLGIPIVYEQGTDNDT